MDFVCDFHVKKVLEFMQDNLPCDKLVGIAEGIAQIAPIIWGRYERTPVNPLALECPPIRATVPPPQ